MSPLIITLLSACLSILYGEEPKNPPIPTVDIIEEEFEEEMIDPEELE